MKRSTTGLKVRFFSIIRRSLRAKRRQGNGPGDRFRLVQGMRRTTDIFIAEAADRDRSAQRSSVTSRGFRAEAQVREPPATSPSSGFHFDRDQGTRALNSVIGALCHPTLSLRPSAPIAGSR
jgi:hypothetical protein